MDKLEISPIDAPRFTVLSIKNSSSESRLAPALDIYNNNNNEETSSFKDNSESNSKYRFLGLFLSFVSGVLYTLSTLIVKILRDEGYHPFLISSWRFIGVLLPCLFIVLWDKTRILEPVFPVSDRKKRKMLGVVMVRGIAGCWAVVLQFYGIKYLSVADSTVITTSTSVFVTVFAHFFIQEKCALVPILTACLAIFGVVIIAQPPLITGQAEFDTEMLKGIGLAVGCMIISAAVIVWQRYMKSVHYSIGSFSSGFWGSVQCLLLTFALSEFQWPESWTHALYAVAVGIVTFFAQITLNISLQLEKAGPVALVQSADSIAAFGWQFFLLGVIPNEYSVIGAAVITSGVFITALRKWLDDLPANNSMRKCFGFLLY